MKQVQIHNAGPKRRPLGSIVQYTAALGPILTGIYVILTFYILGEMRLQTELQRRQQYWTLRPYMSLSEGIRSRRLEDRLRVWIPVINKGLLPARGVTGLAVIDSTPANTELPRPQERGSLIGSAEGDGIEVGTDIPATLLLMFRDGRVALFLHVNVWYMDQADSLHVLKSVAELVLTAAPDTFTWKTTEKDERTMVQ